MSDTLTIPAGKLYLHEGNPTGGSYPLLCCKQCRIDLVREYPDYEDGWREATPSEVQHIACNRCENCNRAVAQRVLLVRYTNAGENYDGFGTVTLEQTNLPARYGGNWRKVGIVEEHLDWQEMWYGSGFFACFLPADFETNKAFLVNH